MKRKTLRSIIIPCVVASFFLVSCSSNRTGGIIVDASMNTITIVNGTDTISFGTMGADRTEAFGFIVGDSATIYYSKRNPSQSQNAVYAASKIIVSPASKAY